MTEERVKFDLDNITLGQLEFLTDYTGRTSDELLEAFANREIYGRDIIAILAIGKNPADPAAAVEDVRNLAVADVQLDFDSGVSEEDDTNVEDVDQDN